MEHLHFIDIFSILLTWKTSICTDFPLLQVWLPKGRRSKTCETSSRNPWVSREQKWWIFHDFPCLLYVGWRLDGMMPWIGLVIWKHTFLTLTCFFLRYNPIQTVDIDCDATSGFRQVHQLSSRKSWITIAAAATTTTTTNYYYYYYYYILAHENSINIP